MAKKSRYLAYAQSIQKREKRKSSPVSILKRLQELKEQTNVVNTPESEGQNE